MCHAQLQRSVYHRRSLLDTHGHVDIEGRHACYEQRESSGSTKKVREKGTAQMKRPPSASGSGLPASSHRAASPDAADAYAELPSAFLPIHPRPSLDRRRPWEPQGSTLTSGKFVILLSGLLHALWLFSPSDG